MRALPRLRVAVPALLATALSAAGPAEPSRQLTFEQRVEAQRAIERVYYSHQQGATRPFDEAVPREVLEEKVRTYLKQSVALEKFWRTPVTAEALQREMERIEANTLYPDRLQEIYDALDNDAFLIQETLVRASLVGRLARSFFASDERIHGAARAEAERLRGQMAAGAVSVEREDPRRTVVDYSGDGAGRVLRMSPATDSSQSVHTLPAGQDDQFERERALAPDRVAEVGPVTEEPGAFVIRTLLAEGRDSFRIGIHRVEKSSWQGWWERVRADLRVGAVRAVASARVGLGKRPAGIPGARRRAPGSSVDPPAGACSTEGVWDNGSLDDSPRPRYGHSTVWTGLEMIVWGGSGGSTGDRYDPLTDTWAAMSTDRAPGKGPYVWIAGSAVWSGSEMIVWDGETGGRYSPGEDRWRPISATNAPRNGLAVWTGSEMIVWDGLKGGRYDVAGDSWRPISSDGGPPVLGSVVWTGREMIVWGGPIQADDYEDRYGTDAGARYDPILDRWSPTSRSGAPSRRYLHTATWTDREMIVWGGFENEYNGETLDTGGRYDPATDTWIAMSRNNAPEARAHHGAVWTGAEMIIWGGRYLDVGSVSGASYDPIGDRWESIGAVSEPKVRGGPSAVWTGSLMVVWGGDAPTGGRYDPAADAWTPTASASAGMPPRSAHHSAVWTGNVMIIWGGSPSGERGIYDPLADAWSVVSSDGAPPGGSAVWAGDEMFVWDGLTGGRYDPIRDEWRQISRLAHPPASSFTLVWTGREIIAWGGARNAYSHRLSAFGARYHPESDTWSSISKAGAPTARSSHTAIWTGSRMLVWGGLDSYYTAGGGIYDPSTDSWVPMSTERAPAARWRHRAVWTGREMIVWGGSNAGYPTNTGGRYDPASDTWAPMSTVSAPTARHDNTAVWTGREMIVWGGHHNGGAYSGTGGRYDPAADAWLTLPTQDAPSPRTGHTAVWTGREMVVWGGSTIPSESGGRYFLEGDPDSDGDGLSACHGDCDDGNPAVRPGAVELPGNSLDEDCDGVVACDSSRPWRSRGRFVGCVTAYCRGLVHSGLLEAPQCREAVGQARLASLCGDGVRQGEETCDGRDLAGRTCQDRGFDGGMLACEPSCGSFDTSGCTTICGDGLIRGREVCDGEDVDGETCQAQGTPGGSLACNDRCDGYDLAGCIRCGNDRREGTDDGYDEYWEDCDGADLSGETCERLGYDGGTLACDSWCGFDLSGCTAVCGDGIRRGEERCDGDASWARCEWFGFYGGTVACNADCTWNTSSCLGRCGDGIREGSEQCDGAEMGGLTCHSLGYVGGAIGCTRWCTPDESGCTTVCGDGVRQGVELCDGSDVGQARCQGFGFAMGGLGCAADCTAYDISDCRGFCGDGQRQGAERCDGEDVSGQTCRHLGFTSGTLVCNADCSLDTSGCQARCGDGVRNSFEVCDGSNVGGVTCQAYGFPSGTVTCRPDCQGFDTSGCNVCGNGVRDGAEVCDGRDLSMGCGGLGFNAGVLACSSTCDAYDTTACCCWDGREGCPVCPTCGNGIREAPFEACDRLDMGGQTCESQGWGTGELVCNSRCDGFFLGRCSGPDP